MSYEIPTCVKCGAEYSMPEGYEATAWCNPCAQELVPELLEALEVLIAPDNGKIRAAELKANFAKARAVIKKAKGR
jgi:hypothetical protein